MRTLGRFVMSVLVLAWAAVAALVVALFSTVEEAPIDEQLARLGLDTLEPATVETAAGLALVVALGVHLVAAVITSRARAAMAGAIGGVLGASIAGAAALVSDVGPSCDRADAIGALTQPAAILTVAAIGGVVGARAYLAHVGRWRYSNTLHIESWDDGGVD